MSIDTPAPPTQSKPRFFAGIGCWASLAVVASSLFLYLIACAAPAMVLEKETWRGYQVLIMGWMGFFLGQLAWFANPFWFLSLLLAFFRRWILTFIVSGIAMLIAFDAFSFVGKTIPLDEANVNTTIFLRYDLGFYFWLAALIAMPAGALVAWVVTRATHRKV